MRILYISHDRSRVNGNWSKNYRGGEVSATLFIAPSSASTLIGLVEFLNPIYLHGYLLWLQSKRQRNCIDQNPNLLLPLGRLFHLRQERALSHLLHLFTDK